MALKHQNITANGLTLRYGSLTIRTLRDFYGSFAPHCADSKKLSEVLPDLDAALLTLLVRDYKSGRLEKICQPGRIHVEWAMPKRPDLDRRI
jgi:transposase-like protein